MPGELGEILPQMDSIPLPKIDETVHPDFVMRNFQFRPGGGGPDAMMWGNRLGMRRPYGRQAAHGFRDMTDNEHTMTNHPEWFALYGDKRQNQPDIGNSQLCYSNEELFAEAVRFAQVQFDHYDMDVVSIMPPDGYSAICQCDLCEGKESPELGPRGNLSNHVWDFVNRVAKEIAKSHPGKMISNCAYGTYTEPPGNIDKLEPNVQVIIVGGRRPNDPDPENIRRIREAWTKKTDNPIEIFENYPFTARNFYLPVFNPTVLGEGINATKGISRGEDVWLSMDYSEKGGGLNHFMVYFTARMYWGGKDQVIGTQPSIDLPWHINLCRQRVRDSGTEHSAFAPTGTKGFHVPMKFGYFHKGKSHQFEADPSVTDYLIESDKAKKLIQAKKREEALAIYLALADDEKVTPRQESLALERAVNCARALKDGDLEKELRERLGAVRR